MQAKDFYSVGLKAYNGDNVAREKFFQMFSEIVLPIAPKYGLLPSYAMAKAVIETGYMTDEWNDTITKITGQQLKAKAQDYNCVYCMNDWKVNEEYLDYLPLPAWSFYKTSFDDYGVHGFGEQMFVKMEPWKSYQCLEDAVEDWCATVRCQSAMHGFTWNPSDLTAQLLATESYTPEGDTYGVRKGLHFRWQEEIMVLYETYNLGKYDEMAREKVQEGKMTIADLDHAIKQSYEYAKANCHYAPCVGYPPMENGTADCAGLATRALYLLGILTSAANIDQVEGICLKAGLVKSTNMEDVWKNHGVVCMQDNGLEGTPHVSHVYYSLGGTSVNDINKYDLGSDQRIHSAQPFTHVPVNEWTDRRHFKSFFYLPKKAGFENTFTGKPLFEAKVRSRYCTARELGRKSAKLLYKIPKGATVPVYAAVSTTKEIRWYYIKYNGKYAWVIKSAFEPTGYKIPPVYASVRGMLDGILSCRIGAGTEYPQFPPNPTVKNGTKFKVINLLTAADGSLWANVCLNKYVYFVSAMYLVTDLSHK